MDRITAAEARKLLAKPKKKRSKFGAEKTIVDGITHDSKAESRRWLDLLNLQRAGEIWGLQRQVRFRIEINGERVCDYIADAVYYERGPGGEEVKVVEDSKGFATREYRLKKKLMHAVHGVTIREVRAG